MKTITINTAAVWSGGVSSWQDGDIFRESFTDTWTTSIADRIGYLKAQSDVTVKLTGSQTVAGDKTLSGITTFDGQVVANNFVTFHDTLQFDANADAGIRYRFANGTDAAQNLTTAYDAYRVPGIGANRVWTVMNTPTPPTGRRLRVTRSRTADAFSLTLQREDTTTLAVFAASQQGWVELVYTSGGWKVEAWGGTVSSVNTDV